jgi:hypothetical protein
LPAARARRAALKTLMCSTISMELIAISISLSECEHSVGTCPALFKGTRVVLVLRNSEYTVGLGRVHGAVHRPVLDTRVTVVRSADWLPTCRAGRSVDGAGHGHGHASVTPYAVMATARCVTGFVRLNVRKTCVRSASVIRCVPCRVSAGGFQLVCVWIVATAVLITLVVRPFAPSGYLKLLRPIIRDFITATV